MFSSTRGCMFLNQTFSRRRAMVFTMPLCPAYAILTALFCSASGSTNRCPLRMMLSLCASDSSARLACRVWNVALFMPSSTPCHLLVRMAWMTVVSVLSFAVSLATSSIVIALGLRLRGCSLYIPLLFFVLCRLVVGALDGGWDSQLGCHSLICIWRSCRMVAFSKPSVQCVLIVGSGCC